MGLTEKCLWKRKNKINYEHKRLNHIEVKAKYTQ